MARKPASKLAQAYRDLWLTDQGKLVLTDLMTRSGVMTDDPDMLDATAIAIEKGQKRIGLYIVQQLCSKPSDFVDVARESSNLLEHFFEET